jgi:hypothetical protein
MYSAVFVADSHNCGSSEGVGVDWCAYLLVALLLIKHAVC